MRTPSVPPVSTAMAPIQVGACWRPTGSVRSPSTSTFCTSPSSRSIRPGTSTPCSNTSTSGPYSSTRATADPLGELLVVKVVEEVDSAQLVERDRAHAIARYWWISETAIEPSPTALATRLIERARTSPATKIPGTLVSSG